MEEHAGYAKARIAPQPGRRLGWLSARLDTRHGTILSRWEYQTDGQVRYEITTPVESEIIINGKRSYVPSGRISSFIRNRNEREEKAVPCGEIHDGAAYFGFANKN